MTRVSKFVGRMALALGTLFGNNVARADLIVDQVFDPKGAPPLITHIPHLRLKVFRASGGMPSNTSSLA
jgi:hypothetical protein